MLRTLNYRLHFLLMLVALPGLIAVFLQTLSERDSAIEDYRIQSDQIALNMVEAQLEIIEETQQFLIELSRMDAVKTPADPACSALLADLLPLKPIYVNLGVPGTDGQLLCNALPMTRPVNVADRPYIRRALDDGVFSVGTFQIDRMVGTSSLNFAYPVRASNDEGPIVGAAVAVVSLDWWSDRLSRHQLPEGGVALVVDAEGTVAVQHPAKLNLLGQPLSAAFAQDQTVPRFDTDSAAVGVGPDGVRLVYSRRVLFKDQAGRQIYALIGIPVEQALRSANANALVRFLFLGGGLLLAWSMAMGLLTRDVLRPLVALTAAVKGMEAGEDREQDRGQTSRVSEFLQLDKRFELMAGARRAAEAAELQRGRQLEALLDALPDLYFRLDADGYIQEYRAATDADLLLPSKEFMGRKMDLLLPGTARRLFQENMKRHATTRDLVTWEYPLEVDGKPMEFEARACPVEGSGETILVIRNITERRRAEEGLRLSAMVYENSSEGMIVMNPEGVVTSANPAVSTQTGYRIDKLVGRRFSKLVPREHRDRLAKHLARLVEVRMAPNGDYAEDTSWSGELAFRHADGGQFPVWLSINLVEADSFAPRRFVILSRDMTDLYEANETIWHQAHFDSLTELPNRVSLAEGLGRAIARAQDEDEDVALLFLDLDRLKQVNDRMGHSGGDLVLSEVAARLRDCVEPDDLVARQGGDEFIIVLTGPDAAARSKDVAVQAIHAISEPYHLGGQLAHMSGSLGVALYPRDAHDGEGLLQAADLAMYAAKLAGGNRVNHFSAKIGEMAQDRLHLMEDLHDALEGGQFDLHFQPIIELSTGQIVKVEALLRWNHPSLGLIGPDRFIPLAEEARQMDEIGNWVLARACAALPRLRARFGPGLKLCLNVSPVQLSSSNDSLAGWADCIAQAELEPGAIVAEITENAFLGTNPTVAARLGELQRMGLHLALDDFGTGYATLQHFLTHDFDFLKIDRAFVKDLPQAPAARILCETMLDLARRLDAKVIAEGIETAEQRAFLNAYPGICGQGFLFSPPVGLEECLRLPRCFPPV